MMELDLLIIPHQVQICPLRDGGEDEYAWHRVGR